MSSEIKVFLADDDQDDRLFIRQALLFCNKEIKFIEVLDGLNLITALRSSGETGDRVIIVDMNMPRMNGLEAIKAIKSDPELIDIPAVMLSTSSDEWLIGKAQNAGVQRFFIKPASFDGFIELAGQICKEFSIPILGQED